MIADRERAMTDEDLRQAAHKVAITAQDIAIAHGGTPGHAATILTLAVVEYASVQDHDEEALAEQIRFLDETLAKWKAEQ